MENTKKRILIIGINYSPELTGIGKYTGEMLEWLAENGYLCTVITSFPYYPNWKVQEPYSGRLFKKEIYKNGDIIVYRCPFYVPENPSGLKRMIHEASFFASSFFQIIPLLFKQKNQHIFCIAPPFHLGFLALFYKFFKGGKINYHIQDLQIEAARDLKVVNSNFIFNILFGMEKFILKRVDSISSISVGMRKKISDKTARVILNFPNWVDTNKFFPISDKDKIKTIWGYKHSDKIVLYSGSIGEKQGLEALIDIAIQCLNHTDINFIICGNGPNRQNLENLAISKGASNLKFMPLQSNEKFNEFLNLADIHLVLQKSEASDLVMPSKLTTILASGGLVIATAIEGTSLFNEIFDNKMGIVIPPEDNLKLKEAILQACNQDYSEIQANAKRYANQFLNMNSILSQMEKSIL
ncbi:MAG: WcaI family glycosyltransferase [bacterium]|nr:WcaI family glycosyltransferase [bacterium]